MREYFQLVHLVGNILHDSGTDALPMWVTSERGGIPRNKKYDLLWTFSNAYVILTMNGVILREAKQSAEKE